MLSYGGLRGPANVRLHVGDAPDRSPAAEPDRRAATSRRLQAAGVRRAAWAPWIVGGWTPARVFRTAGEDEPQPGGGISSSTGGRAVDEATRAVHGRSALPHRASACQTRKCRAARHNLPHAPARSASREELPRRAAQPPSRTDAARRKGRTAAQSGTRLPHAPPRRAERNKCRDRRRRPAFPPAAVGLRCRRTDQCVPLTA
jgi:hypothetical protein